MSGPAQEAEGLAGLVMGLVAQNLERDPARGRLLRGGTVAIVAIDAGVGVRFDLVPGVPWVAGESVGAPVEVRAPSVALMALAAAPLRFGLPDVLSRDGRTLLGGILRGTIRVRGLVRHLPTVRRLTMLLSAR